MYLSHIPLSLHPDHNVSQREIRLTLQSVLNVITFTLMPRSTHGEIGFQI